MEIGVLIIIFGVVVAIVSSVWTGLALVVAGAVLGSAMLVRH